MAELFRIKYGYRASSSSSTSVEHFESRKALAMKLLDVQSEIVAFTPNSRGGLAAAIENMFRKRRGDKDLSNWNARKADRVLQVQQFKVDTWVDVEYEFVPAHLTIGGELYVDPR